MPPPLPNDGDRQIFSAFNEIAAMMKGHRHVQPVTAWMTAWLLREAEERYGPRDLSFEFYGVEYLQHAQAPNVSYIGQKHVVIVLSDSCRLHHQQAMFQLSHEAVHLLSPHGPHGVAHNIEEGTATLYSYEVMRWFAPDYKLPKEGQYTSALRDVETLMAADPDAVLKLRSIEPNFSAISPELIHATVPGLPHDVADRLCQPWNPTS